MAVSPGSIRCGLDFFAALAQIGKHRVDAFLIDGADPLGGYSEPDPSVLAGYPESVVMDVGVEHPFRPVVSMGNIMAYNTVLSRHLAYSGHREPRKNRQE
jgi:hypothetical protein